MHTGTRALFTGEGLVLLRPPAAGKPFHTSSRKSVEPVSGQLPSSTVITCDTQAAAYTQANEPAISILRVRGQYQFSSLEDACGLPPSVMKYFITDFPPQHNNNGTDFQRNTTTRPAFPAPTMKLPFPALGAGQPSMP